MHYYRFNIGDYYSHTAHLDPIEDIVYRRMIDWLYLHERKLPNDTNEIARLIRMRSHNDSIEIVLREFFSIDEDGCFSERALLEINEFKAKSEKAKASANARWHKNNDSGDANALQTDSESNANHKPINNNHKTINKDKRSSGVPYQKIVDLYHELLPDLSRVEKLTAKRKSQINQRWKQDLKTLEEWSNFFIYISKNNFLMGRVEQAGGRSAWKASLEWITKESNFVKIKEENYTNG